MRQTKSSIKPLWAGAIGLLATSILASCGPVPAEHNPAGGFTFATKEDQTPTIAPESSSALSTSPDDGQPGESPDVQAGDPVTIQQDCVFIQWCNQPSNVGPWGSVCQVRRTSTCLALCNTAAGRAAIANECTGDANAVCGGITQPAIIFGCP
jgi:hypothetical protein